MLTSAVYAGSTGNMKATIDIPDDLHRQLKARSVLHGRSIRGVTIELYRRWLAEAPELELPTDDASSSTDAEKWLASWDALGERLRDAAADGRTTRDILMADRR